MLFRALGSSEDPLVVFLIRREGQDGVWWSPVCACEVRACTCGRGVSGAGPGRPGAGGGGFECLVVSEGSSLKRI